MSWASKNHIGMVCGKEINFGGIPHDVGLRGFVCNAHCAYGIRCFLYEKRQLNELGQPESHRHGLWPRNQIRGHPERCRLVWICVQRSWCIWNYVFNMILVHFLKSVTHHRGTFHFVGVLTASFLQAPPNANCICKESKWPVTCIYRISYSRVPYQCWPFQSVVSVACLFPALSMRIALAKKIIGL